MDSVAPGWLGPEPQDQAGGVPQPSRSNRGTTSVAVEWAGGGMHYEIRVEGELDAGWSNWLQGMTLLVEERGPQGSVTTLSGPVEDQSALRGILNKLWDLNLDLVSVVRREAQEESHEDDLHPTFGR